MKLTKEGISEKKKVRPKLPGQFIGNTISCRDCKAEFILEAKDDWWLTGRHHDTIFFVDCAHCGEAIYIGNDR